MSPKPSRDWAEGLRLDLGFKVWLLLGSGLEVEAYLGVSENRGP